MSVSFTFQFSKAKAAVLYLAHAGLPEFTKGKVCILFIFSTRHNLSVTLVHHRILMRQWCTADSIENSEYFG